MFVTREGRVKILDFGLAKLTRPETAPAAPTSAPTVARLTETGTLLGTVGYMSPEQVRGLSVDPRSDIFTFGAMYEMLTGRRSFEGGTAADTMSAILKEEPPDLAQSSRGVPPELERIVHDCLEKIPDERFQSARDLAFDLSFVTGASSPRSGKALSPAVPAKRRPYQWALHVLVPVVTLAVGPIAGLDLGRAPSPSLHQITFRQGTLVSARFAPEGQIFYSASWGGGPIEVYSTSPGSPESRSFGPSDSDLLSVSASGEIAIGLHSHASGAFTRSSTLAEATIAGGNSPREVVENVEWADWSPDGKDLTVVREVGQRCSLEFPVGRVLVETEGWMSHPRVSPRGDQVAFIDHPVRNDDGGSVAVVDRSGRERMLSKVFATAEGLAWSPDGQAYLFPLEGGKPTGLPGFGPRDLACDWSADGRALFVLETGELPARVDRLDIGTGHRVLWRELAPSDPAGVIDIPRVCVTPDGKFYACNVVRDLSDLFLVEGLG